jgi:hypothetical protein
MAIPNTIPVLNIRVLGEGWLNNPLNLTNNQISKCPDSKAGEIEHQLENNPDNTTIVIAGK